MKSEIALKCARKHALTTNIIGNAKRSQVCNSCIQEKVGTSVENRSQAPNGAEMNVRKNVPQISRMYEVDATAIGGRKGVETGNVRVSGLSVQNSIKRFCILRTSQVETLAVIHNYSVFGEGNEGVEGMEDIKTDERQMQSNLSEIKYAIRQQGDSLLGRDVWKQAAQAANKIRLQMPAKFPTQTLFQTSSRSSYKESTQTQLQTTTEFSTTHLLLAQFLSVTRSSIEQHTQTQLETPSKFPTQPPTASKIQPLSRLPTQQVTASLTAKQPTQTLIQISMSLPTESFAQTTKFQIKYNLPIQTQSRQPTYTLPELPNQTSQRNNFQNALAKQPKSSHLTQAVLQIQPPYRSQNNFQKVQDFAQRLDCAPLPTTSPTQNKFQTPTEVRILTESPIPTELPTQHAFEHRTPVEVNTRHAFEHRTAIEVCTQHDFEHRNQTKLAAQEQFSTQSTFPTQMQHFSYDKTSQETPHYQPQSLEKCQSDQKTISCIPKCQQTSTEKLVDYSFSVERQPASQESTGKAKILSFICHSPPHRTHEESQISFKHTTRTQQPNYASGQPHSINILQCHTSLSDWRDWLFCSSHYRRRKRHPTDTIARYLHLSYLWTNNASLLLFSTLLLLLTALPCVRATCRVEPARACEAICTADGLNCTLRALLLLPDDDSYVASMRRSLPVMHLAEQYIREYSLLPPQLRWEWMTGDVKCDAAYATIKAMDGIVKNCAHVVFGPVCDYALAAVSRIAKYFNHNGTPVISIGGATDSFEVEKTSCADEFYMLLRSGLLSFKSISLMIIELLKRYNWTNAIVFYERDGQKEVIGEHSCYLMMKSFGNEMRDLNLTFAQYSIMPDLYNRTEELKREIGNKHANEIVENCYPFQQSTLQLQECICLSLQLSKMKPLPNTFKSAEVSEMRLVESRHI